MFNNPTFKKIVLFSLLAGAVALVGYAYYYSQVAPLKETEVPIVFEEEQTPVPEVETTVDSEDVIINPTATPTPKMIPQGKRGFSVSMSNNVKGPRIGRGELDPYDPALNQKQKLTIEVNDTVPVESVVAILQTDNKTSPEYQLIPNTPNQLIGNWTGEWIVDDSYLYTYVLTIKATSASGTSQIDITLR